MYSQLYDINKSPNNFSHIHFDISPTLYYLHCLLHSLHYLEWPDIHRLHIELELSTHSTSHTINFNRTPIQSSQTINLDFPLNTLHTYSLDCKTIQPPHIQLGLPPIHPSHKYICPSFANTT